MGQATHRDPPHMDYQRWCSLLAADVGQLLDVIGALAEDDPHVWVRQASNDLRMYVRLLEEYQQSVAEWRLRRVTG